MTAPFSSRDYWERRYATGNNSGRGSYGKLARFKAKFLNDFVKRNKIEKVVDFGCGDGNMASLFEFPKYIGLDVSKTAIKRCIERCRNNPAGKSFLLYNPEDFNPLNAELTLSLDVIYHLVEDNVFEVYMKHLFASSYRYVIIYSTDIDETTQFSHIKHRKFTDWIPKNLPSWKLIEYTTNLYPHETEADFYIFMRSPHD